ncbi:SOS response-associated peptidase [bacterium]|nr:SOS response-associated peptidase [bacterium]
MCGRKTLTKGKEEIIENLLVDEWQEGYKYTPSFNVAPTQLHPILLKQGDKRMIKPMNWGLVPAWSKDKKVATQMINARVETLKDKPAFAELLDTQRCVVIADGWYEWEKIGKEKQPYYFFGAGHPILAMAGLYSKYQVTSTQILHTYTIITREAMGDLATVHHRMPTLLSNENQLKWLDVKSLPYKELDRDILDDYSDIKFYPVSPEVNITKNNHADLIKPWEIVKTASLFPQFEA